jgi:predicted nucleic acid-binding protein
MARVNVVVVDTSVWIDFFGGRGCDRLEEALEVGSIVTPPLVVAGAAQRREKQRP